MALKRRLFQLYAPSLVSFSQFQIEIQVKIVEGFFKISRESAIARKRKLQQYCFCVVRCYFLQYRKKKILLRYFRRKCRKKKYYYLLNDVISLKSEELQFISIADIGHIRCVQREKLPSNSFVNHCEIFILF